MQFLNGVLDLKSSAKFFGACLILTLLGAAVGLVWQPDLHSFIGMLEDKGMGEAQAPWRKFLGYVTNNGMKVPAQMTLFSLIPLPFVYFLPVAFTAVLGGFILYVPFAPELADKLQLSQVLVGIFPHALLELGGFCLLLPALVQLNRWVRSKLWRRLRVPATFLQVVTRVLGAFVVAFVVLTAAAAIEAFITPLLG